MIYFFQISSFTSSIIITSTENIKENEELTNLSSFLSQSLTSLFDTFWIKLSHGLSLSEIENLLFFLLSIRFLILALKYNIKTSFYITCIGLAAGYLWYRHLIDLISIYADQLYSIPFFEKLSFDALKLKEYYYSLALNSTKLESNIKGYNIGRLAYYALIKGITNFDSETKSYYYIDPISMIVANLSEPTKSNIIPYYYKVYKQIIPNIFNIVRKIWGQLAGIAAYSLVTRIGKKYCPYLVRWHWTFLLILGLFEMPFQYLISRAEFFEEIVLFPRLILSTPNADLASVSQAIKIMNYFDIPLIEFNKQVYEQTFIQLVFLKIILSSFVICHMSFVLFGLFHAIWGQYFYFPFLVRNAELHIGPRPKNSIYSGGYTAWQDKEEKERILKNSWPRVWYGWFGRGTNQSLNLFRNLQNIYIKWLKKVRKKFKR